VLGSMLGFNFADFATHTGPVSIMAALLLLMLFYLRNRKALKNAHSALTEDAIIEIEALHQEPVHAHLTRVGIAGFTVSVVLLILHVPLSDFTGLPINGAVAALIPAALAIIALRGDQRKKVILNVDGESILFFAGLFVLIGGLEKVHILERLAEGLAQASSTNPTGLVMALQWGPGLASGIVDNVPLALAMGYVIKDIAAIPGMPALALMAWSLALGVDIGGNFTPIGASANVVAYAYMERNHGSIGWKRWLILAGPPTVLIMILVSLLVVLKGHIGWY
jgi:Na+/H+ antiporter NhaD/arsenite permease-like protein